MPIEDTKIDLEKNILEEINDKSLTQKDIAKTYGPSLG